MMLNTCYFSTQDWGNVSRNFLMAWLGDLNFGSCSGVSHCAVELLTQSQKRVEYRDYRREQRAAVYEDTFENPSFSFSVFETESHVDQDSLKLAT